MGILLFYEGDGRIAGEIANRHWREMRRIFPSLIDWVNQHMKRPPSAAPPTLIAGPFKLSAMLRDDADKSEELNLIGLPEWKRLFAWCDFLAPHDDTFQFFAPTVQLFRTQSRHPDELRQA